MQEETADEEAAEEDVGEEYGEDQHLGRGHKKQEKEERENISEVEGGQDAVRRREVLVGGWRVNWSVGGEQGGQCLRKDNKG